MPTKYKNKVKLQVWISEKIYKKLIEIAPSIYGSHKGALSYVVEQALKDYLAPLHTQIRTNPPSRVRLKYELLLSTLKKLKGYRPHQVKEWEFERAVADTFGTDPRTIRKYKEQFRKFGLIKFVGGTYPNRIIELL